VSIYPTHSELTNEVIDRNHRIGVSISGFFDWIDSRPLAEVIRWLRDGYKVVEGTNLRLAVESDVRPSVRLTTVKPSGTVSLLAGVSPGANPPHSNRWYLRRITLNNTSSM